ncbi:hypothetical protein EHQ12_04175 [Leptospira gomenensis]|uniref:Uncharacterized protein n=1 Tax=Leptospira gomenensis TaxID=2484974 RepID=A0A5F1YDI8_9LEPT|nr:hypothetical protein [Leptospira gomenensis]TGK36187.1 hypothetical protein EHQ17_04540 [Leptospira gomenensis]TGK42773.1 hypothetical protein EHQ07_13950 [Leptospira gomenensis]TGK42962.1 hypothetical protein EHQ12_04175 [Leptospira gomenensis]TGK54973.1 hypothetical protein EHQ13_18430 [Leptospira gomenensis]
MYQVIRRGDLLPRWMTASDFVTQFKRLEGIPEPVRISWIESDYKKIAVEEDNVSGALLASWQNRVLRKNERTMKESA